MAGRTPAEEGSRNPGNHARRWAPHPPGREPWSCRGSRGAGADRPRAHASCRRGANRAPGGGRDAGPQSPSPCPGSTLRRPAAGACRDAPAGCAACRGSNAHHGTPSGSHLGGAGHVSADRDAGGDRDSGARRHTADRAAGDYSVPDFERAIPGKHGAGPARGPRGGWARRGRAGDVGCMALAAPAGPLERSTVTQRPRAVRRACPRKEHLGDEQPESGGTARPP